MDNIHIVTENDRPFMNEVRELCPGFIGYMYFHHDGGMALSGNFFTALFNNDEMLDKFPAFVRLIKKHGIKESAGGDGAYLVFEVDPENMDHIKGSLACHLSKEAIKYELRKKTSTN